MIPSYIKIYLFSFSGRKMIFNSYNCPNDFLLSFGHQNFDNNCHPIWTYILLFNMLNQKCLNSFFLFLFFDAFVLFFLTIFPFTASFTLVLKIKKQSGIKVFDLWNMTNLHCGDSMADLYRHDYIDRIDINCIGSVSKEKAMQNIS